VAAYETADEINSRDENNFYIGSQPKNQDSPQDINISGSESNISDWD